MDSLDLRKNMDLDLCDWYICLTYFKRIHGQKLNK